jgi:hypothetical protein
MLPYHRTLGDKKLCLAFFIVPNSDIQFMFGHGSVNVSLCLVMGVLENFYREILFIYLVGGVW